jgi:hypothetical protein
MVEDKWLVTIVDGAEVYYCQSCNKHVAVGSRTSRGRILGAADCKKAINKHWPRVHDHKWVIRRGPNNEIRYYCREGCNEFAEVGSIGRKGERRTRDSCQNSMNYHWKKEHKYNLHQGVRQEGGLAALVRSCLLWL